MAEPVSECLLMVLMVRGCEVAVRTNGNDVHITCAELPQVSVSDSTLDGALARAEDAIQAIQAGEFAKRATVKSATDDVA